MSDALVDVIVEAPGWNDALPGLDGVAALGARLAVEARGLDPADFTLAVLACDDTRIRDLNVGFRGMDKATNVLSWPAFELAPKSPGGTPDLPPKPTTGDPVFLGDVAIALQTCTHEAENASIPLKNHVLHLILHGCLHLLGYDHEAEADAHVMEGLERDALMGLGISDPYA